MPIRRTKKRYVPRRRRNFKRKRFGRPRMAIQRQVGPVADAQLVKLTYSTNLTTASTSTPVTQILQTSLFDPYQGAGGHQPLGRDQWDNFYQRYRIYGMKYDIVAINTSTTNQVDVSVIYKPTTSTASTQDQMWELPNSYPRVLGIEGAGNATTRFKGYMSVARVWGISNQRVNNDDIFQALFGANPSRMAYLHCSSITSDAASASTVRWRIRVTYYCKLFERRTLVIS